MGSIGGMHLAWMKTLLKEAFEAIALLVTITLPIVVAIGSFWAIESLTGGLLRSTMEAMDRDITEVNPLGLELGLVPWFVGIGTAWGLCKLFRLKKGEREMVELFSFVRPVFSALAKFAAVVFAFAHLFTGHVLTAIAHFAVAVALFVLFMRAEKKREAEEERRNKQAKR